MVLVLTLPPGHYNTSCRHGIGRDRGKGRQETSEGEEARKAGRKKS